MSNEVPDIALVKNQWLSQQVDVQFPTKESLAGRKVYQQKVAQCSYKACDMDLQSAAALEQTELFTVDFHRLTIMFSLLQATRWQEPSDRELIVEFLTQIIYSEPCELVLAFSNGEPIAGAIVTIKANEALISDIVIDNGSSLTKEQFINALKFKFIEPFSLISELYIESDDK